MAGNLRRLGPLELVVNASGAGTGYIGDGMGNNVAQSLGVTGKIVAIQYVTDGTIPYSDSFVVAITAENSGLAIYAATVTDGDASFNAFPLAAAAKAATGAASTLSEVQVPLVNERIKVAITSGGNATQGQWFAIVE